MTPAELPFADAARLLHAKVCRDRGYEASWASLCEQAKAYYVALAANAATKKSEDK